MYDDDATYQCNKSEHDHVYVNELSYSFFMIVSAFTMTLILTLILKRIQST